MVDAVEPLRINAVFKGGGAKGLVYIGALLAAEDRKIEFASVAGSSAGAVTAALIAAGLSAEQIGDAVEEALGKFDNKWWSLIRGLVPGTRGSLFSLKKMGPWLDDRLAKSVSNRRSSGPVSFAELHAASGVDLNVVAMDLARKQPIVFNHETTPDCSVSEAVMASSAIPVAMPSRRVRVHHPNGREDIHRLVDGGAWANYPDFVYRDASFRSYHGLSTLAASTTVGFTLAESRHRRQPDRPAAMVKLPVRDSDAGSGSRTGPLGALLRWRPFGWLAFIVVPLVLTYIVVDWLRGQSLDWFPVIEDLPVAFELPALIGMAMSASAVIMLLLTVGLVAARFGREAADVGLSASLAALSVGPGVPVWVGHAGTTDRVVCLSNPQRIKTTTFKIPTVVRECAVKRAYVEAAAQLDCMFPERRPTAAPRFTKRDGLRCLPKERRDEDAHVSRAGYAVALVLVLLALQFSFTSLEDFAFDRLVRAIGWGSLGIVCLMAALGVGAWTRHRRLNNGVVIPQMGPSVAWLLIGGVALLALSYALANPPDSIRLFADAEVHEARVVDVCCDEGSNAYGFLTVLVDEASPIPAITPIVFLDGIEFVLRCDHRPDLGPRCVYFGVGRDLGLRSEDRTRLLVTADGRAQLIEQGVRDSGRIGYLVVVWLWMCAVFVTGSKAMDMQRRRTAVAETQLA